MLSTSHELVNITKQSWNSVMTNISDQEASYLVTITRIHQLENHQKLTSYKLNFFFVCLCVSRDSFVVVFYYKSIIWNLNKSRYYIS